MRHERSGSTLAGSWRALRRRIITPNASAASPEVRGFHRKNADAQELLETIGRTFLAGYGYAVEARTPAEAEKELEEVPTRFRGFAYEGAAMGLAVLDGLSPGRGGRFARFLEGRGRDHVYMAYVGAGWAMARLPRLRWSRLGPFDPLLQWLVLDGYGFHQAYFRTRRYVHEQYRPARFPWPAGGPEWYALRAIDQGIGRAMWFVGGADAGLVATMIDGFPESRRADLYSGAGLAATYAGGAGEEELAEFLRRAGTHRPQVAQACAFAAEARVRAGLVVPHTRVATEVFCGMTPERAAQVSRDVRPDGSSSPGEPPAYELWRQRVADQFLSAGRC
ncbi:enediyne biosynthesis protein [Planomonospora sphaerica]|uniref:Enediyne biosynthesis protein n=1 Tax=Planomonospora sphaerica TaxID=161355 RepID=A0A161LHH9_9ACTN|nr:DUF1702 family protein [Planomonospora sphaerica]GAT67164.1 enediyne biosynthesis protein [Planomonospora sphaerica]